MSTPLYLQRENRHLLHWIAQGTCSSCSNQGLVGYLDGKPIARTCYRCNVTTPIHCEEPKQPEDVVKP